MFSAQTVDWGSMVQSQVAGGKFLLAVLGWLPRNRSLRLKAKYEAKCESEHLTPALLPILLSQNAERETRSQRFPESGHRPLVATDKDSVQRHPDSTKEILGRNVFLTGRFIDW